MIRYPRRLHIFAACLSALAGFVDATGFIQLGGNFVSFMSGNSTRLAVGIVQDRDWHALIPGGIILLFVLGVVAGSLVGHWRAGRRAPSVLAFMTALLLIAAACASLGYAVPAIICMTLAMGAENNIFERNGEVSIGLTYMTGTLVKMGQHMSAALSGGPRLAWVPYFSLWLGLIIGAAAGALDYARFGLQDLWVAAAASLALTIAAIRLDLKS